MDVVMEVMYFPEIGQLQKLFTLHIILIVVIYVASFTQRLAILGRIGLLIPAVIRWWKGWWAVLRCYIKFVDSRRLLRFPHTRVCLRAKRVVEGVGSGLTNWATPERLQLLLPWRARTLGHHNVRVPHHLLHVRDHARASTGPELHRPFFG